MYVFQSVLSYHLTRMELNKVGTLFEALEELGINCEEYDTVRYNGSQEFIPPPQVVSFSGAMKPLPVVESSEPAPNEISSASLDDYDYLSAAFNAIDTEKNESNTHPRKSSRERRVTKRYQNNKSPEHVPKPKVVKKKVSAVPRETVPKKKPRAKKPRNVKPSLPVPSLRTPSPPPVVPSPPPRSQTPILPPLAPSQPPRTPTPTSLVVPSPPPRTLMATSQQLVQVSNLPPPASSEIVSHTIMKGQVSSPLFQVKTSKVTAAAFSSLRGSSSKYPGVNQDGLWKIVMKETCPDIGNTRRDEKLKELMNDEDELSEKLEKELEMFFETKPIKFQDMLEPLDEEKLSSMEKDELIGTVSNIKRIILQNEMDEIKLREKLITLIRGIHEKTVVKERNTFAKRRFDLIKKFDRKKEGIFKMFFELERLGLEIIHRRSVMQYFEKPSNQYQGQSTRTFKVALRQMDDEIADVEKIRNTMKSLSVLFDPDNGYDFQALFDHTVLNFETNKDEFLQQLIDYHNLKFTVRPEFWHIAVRDYVELTDFPNFLGVSETFKKRIEEPKESQEIRNASDRSAPIDSDTPAPLAVGNARDPLDYLVRELGIKPNTPVPSVSQATSNSENQNDNPITCEEVVQKMIDRDVKEPEDTEDSNNDDESDSSEAEESVYTSASPSSDYIDDSDASTVVSGDPDYVPPKKSKKLTKKKQK